MVTYNCKTTDCSGEVSFLDPSEKLQQQNSGPTSSSVKLVVLEDTPSKCPICGISWYESELK